MVKPKKCKCCKNEFTPQNSLAQVCSAECAFALARQNGLKKMEKQTKEKRKELIAKNKTHGYYILALQTQINYIVRLIDMDCVCISCGTPTAQFQAGHFRAVSAWSNLRFHLTNIFRQCSRCNDPKRKGGNVIKYRENIIKNFGQDVMNYMDDLNIIYPSTKLSIDEIKDAIVKAKHITKGLADMNKTDILPRSHERRIELRKQFNNYIGIYT